MSPRTPEQFKEIREDRKKVILGAALHVFAEDGYHLSSVSRIAKKAGFSKGLMYNYFESKEDLLLNLMNSMGDEFEKTFSIKPGDEFKKKDFIEFIHVSFDIVFKDIKHWKLYFALCVQPDVMPVMMEKLMVRAEPFMKSMTNYFSGKGYKDPVAVMRYFSAVIDGVQMHCMLDPKGFPIEQAKKMIIQQFA